MVACLLLGLNVILSQPGSASSSGAAQGTTSVLESMFSFPVVPLARHCLRFMKSDLSKWNFEKEAKSW